MLSETRPAKVGKWTEPALRVLRERYLTRQGGEVVETPEEMCWRVALTIARGEARYGRSEAAVREIAEAFYDIMIEGSFLPNSPTLMNAGKGNGLQYSACYVLPVGDSMEEIFDSVKAAAIIHKSGGGTGFAFSRLRPKDDIVASTGGRASGPVSFLRVFNSATEAVKQGGTRRGANMGILRVDHPDVLEFIDCKLDGGITNFNISVAATDRFMDALASGGEYELINPHSGEVTGRLLAKEVFDRIVRAAWRTGDPGMVFIDRINASPANPTPAIGVVEATNPCGEQPLLPNEACNLGSLNVSKFARKGDAGEWSVDWDEMESAVRLAVRFLDDVIDVNRYPVPELAGPARAARKVGLGVMGLAELLATLGIPYDSPAAVALAGRVFRVLAAERGPFPLYARSTYPGRGVGPLRNAQLTSVAPTGTISLIAGTTSGIEPMFALAYTRHILGRELAEANPLFERLARDRGFYSEQLMADIARTGTVRQLPGLPADVRAAFVTALEIAPAWHLKMQAAVQHHVDAAVAKTVNLPADATPADVRAIYLAAWRARVKGITVYRYGARPGQVLTLATPGPQPGAAVQIHDVYSGGCNAHVCEF